MPNCPIDVGRVYDNVSRKTIESSKGGDRTERIWRQDTVECKMYLGNPARHKLTMVESSHAEWVSGLSDQRTTSWKATQSYTDIKYKCVTT